MTPCMFIQASLFEENYRVLFVYLSSKASLFEDLTPGGALCHIMTTVYRMKTQQSWYAILDIQLMETLPYTSYCTRGPYHQLCILTSSCYLGV